MQNESHFENNNLRGNNEEIVVDCWDILYTLFSKWPLLLAGMLCGAVLLGAFGVMRARRASDSEKPVSIEEQIENARGALGEARASEIEGLYTQYQEYMTLQSLLRNQQTGYLKDLDKINNSYVKTLKFLCTSEESSPLDIYGLQTVLSEDVCLEIGKVIAGETDAKEAVALSRNRVLISVDQDYKLAVSSEEILPTRYIMTISIIGDDKKQCDQIHEIIERKMTRLQQAYVDAGGTLEVTPFATEYANTAADLMKDYINTLSEQMRSVTDSLYVFQQNTIDKLDDDAKAYYELLKEQGRIMAEAEVTGADAQANASQKVSLKSLISKKLVAVGALAGIFLVGLIIVLQYILTRAVQSKDSFAALCGSPLTAAVYKKRQSSTGLLLKLYKLFHTADELTRGKTAAIAQDMGIEMEKKNAGSLYLLLSDNTEELGSFAKALRDDMHSQHPNLKVICGDPLNDREQMKTLSGADAAVLLVELKKAGREDVIRQLQMCGRYQVPVMGSVTLEVV